MDKEQGFGKNKSGLQPKYKMFPAGMFAGTYFPPAYFPKTGAPQHGGGFRGAGATLEILRIIAERRAHYRTNYAGTHVWYENGCLCKLEGFEFAHGQPNWQQGFSVAYSPNDGSRFFLEQIPILSGRILFGGLLWGRRERAMVRKIQ